MTGLGDDPRLGGRRWQSAMVAIVCLVGVGAAALADDAGARAEAVRQLREAYRGGPASWPAPAVDKDVAWKELGLLPGVNHPPENQPNASTTELGRLLFFDHRLSASGQIACASCHEPSMGWTDGRATGMTRGPPPHRNTPTIENTVFHTSFAWDGRAASLEEKTRESLTSATELDSSPEVAVRLITACAEYRELYAEAFPGRAVEGEGVVDAIAAFERSVVGGKSRFDAFLRGNAAALSDAEIIGLDLFRRRAGCMNCHHGPLLSDGGFHDLGMSYYGRRSEDLGKFAVTGKPSDVGRFRTPSLRNVTRTEPLTHTGLFEVPGLINMYDAGMPVLRRRAHQRDDPLFPVKSSHLRPLGLSPEDRADLAAFLGALEEPKESARHPDLPSLDTPPIVSGR